MMQTADNVCWCFSNSPKRQLALEKWISQICSEKKNGSVLRKCAEHVGLSDMKHLRYSFLPIVSCLEERVNSTQSDWNRETRSDANSYLIALSQFSYM